MSITVFEYRDYKKYLNEYLLAQPKQGFGLRSALAEAASCQTAYVSQVLRGSVHFSLEQAEAINAFLGHTQEEGSYFLLLVQFARAGTPALRARFVEAMNQELEKRLVLKHRLEVKKSLSREDQATYYSAWYFAAIHILLTVPKYQTKEAISRYYRLSLSRVSEVLDFLVSVGLAKESGGKFTVGTTRIHLGSDSPLISKHHINWRTRAIHALDDGSRDNLHYSSVVSLSESDAIKIKSMLIKAIEEVKAVVKESPEESMRCFSLDFFGV